MSRGDEVWRRPGLFFERPETQCKPQTFRSAGTERQLEGRGQDPNPDHGIDADGGGRVRPNANGAGVERDAPLGRTRMIQPISPDGYASAVALRVTVEPVSRLIAVHAKILKRSRRQRSSAAKIISQQQISPEGPVVTRPFSVVAVESAPEHGCVTQPFGQIERKTSRPRRRATRRRST